MTQKGPIEKKYPIPSLEEENIQQAVSVVWQLKEQGVNQEIAVKNALEHSINESIFTDMIASGLIVTKGAVVELTPEGNQMAQDIVRRHRLTERFLNDILDLPKDQLDPNACRLEHVITLDVEEAICTLLGHPGACPHGLNIPSGQCCAVTLRQTASVVTALSNLASGQEGRVVYFSPIDRPELHKLLAMGFVPGIEVTVNQVAPAFVVSLGNTMVAMESDLAKHIFIRKKTRNVG